MVTRRKPSKTVLVGGVFDLLHYGHTRFLNRAKSYGNRLVVAVNTDEFVFSYKGKQPILTTKERIEVLKSIKCVDEVIINESNSDWRPTIKKASPMIIVTSSDWLKKNFYNQMGIPKKEFDKMGIELIYIPYTTEISTSKLLERICQRFL